MEAQHRLRAYNPICGDRFDVYLDVEQKSILRIHFHGYGCAISKASTSVMANAIEGKSLGDGLELCNNFLGFINKEMNKEAVNLPLDFVSFAGVHDFPDRYECASLSWREVKKFLESCMNPTQSQ